MKIAKEALETIAPRKSTAGLEPRETTNPRHKAPIPLYPEPTTAVELPEKVKLKLRKDPTKDNSEKYEKEYILFDGTTTEQYCNLRVQLDHYILHAGVTAISAKLAAMSQLITGNAFENCCPALQGRQQRRSTCYKSRVRCDHGSVCSELL